MGNTRLKGQALIYQKLGSALSWPKQAVSVSALQAHRGYWIEGSQENTLSSFRSAFARGFAMIELDVRLSQDGIPVVVHDSDTSRFSVENLEVEETAARTLSRVMNAPTLDQVLKAKDIPHKINIELKTEKIINEALERKVWKVICENSAQRRVIVSSFNPFSLWRFYLYTQDIPLALIVSDDLQNPFLRNMVTLPFLPFHLLHLEKSMLDEETIHFWTLKGVPVSAWTVNDPSEAERLLAAGCLSIITDSVLSREQNFF